MDYKFTKQQLIDALEARRSWAKRLDAKNLRKHKKAEAAALKKFRAQLRGALEWSYAKAKSNYSAARLERPECPKSFTNDLEDALKWLKVDGGKHYFVTSAGHMKRIHYLLSHDENAKPAMC